MKRWIHISDIHFNSDNMSTSLMRRELLRMLRKEGLSCDYVFCTGDIRTASGGAAFPEEAATFLKEICDSARCPSDHLFIVPGNHDVNRTSSGRHKAITDVMFKRRGSYDPADGRIAKESLETIHRGQQDFRNFLKMVLPEERLKLYEDPLKPHFVITTPDFNILHADSTIVYTEEQEAHDLIMGTRHIQEVLETIDPSKPTILLSHFPYFSLLQDEKKHLASLLRSYGVELWLAGHEHDHLLQQIGDIVSLQAGELRHEDKSNATILIGEYDPDNCRGCIHAYTWFPEGWAKYPIISHSGERKDIFRFELKILDHKGMSCLAAMAHKANREFYERQPKEVLEYLFPRITENGSAIPDEMLEEISLRDNIIITADGGMGKTTMLLHHCMNSSLPVLYIPAGWIAATGTSIKDYCILKLFNADSALFLEAVVKRSSIPALTIVIDGLNEVDGDTEFNIIRQVKSLSIYEGIRMVITSRSDFTSRNGISGYRHLSLAPLDESAVKTLFGNDEWNSIRRSGTLHKLLENPMMATMYKEICSVIEEYATVEFLDWHLPVMNATYLLYNYYLAQTAIMMRRGDIDKRRILTAHLCIRTILPRLAFIYETAHVMNMDNTSFRKVIADSIPETDYCNKILIPLQEYLRSSSLPQVSAMEAMDLMINDLHLLYRNTTHTTFPHQIFRDYLSACNIIIESGKPEETERIWNQRDIPLHVMEHVRNLGGNYWNGIAENVRKAGEGRSDAGTLVRNLTICFPASDTGGTPDYSGLDFRGIPLPDNAVTGHRIKMTGAVIDHTSIGRLPSAPKRFENICFSEDNAWLAAVEGNNVHIFSMADGKPEIVQEACTHRFRGMEFCEGYLFVVCDDIHVFLHDGQWHYKGSLTHEKGSLLWKLRFALKKGSRIHFYYNNRERIYDLDSCSILENKQKAHAWQSLGNGIVLESFKKPYYPPQKPCNGIAGEAESNGFRAVGRTDGSLTVFADGEKRWILSQGSPLLKDAAISSDGRYAATLSQKIFNGRRKIQIWDIDAQSRIADFYCPDQVSGIHLSENGDWIIGMTRTRTWVCRRSSGEERWFDERFISNQSNKIATYCDKVIRHDPTSGIYLYDLATGEKEVVDTPHSNPSYVCFMRDGSLASVNRKGTSVSFRSERTGDIMTVTPKNACAIGLQTVKKHPFICIAKDDGHIAMYHVGTGQCLQHDVNKGTGSALMVIHPEKTLIACSNRRKRLGAAYLHEDTSNKKTRGWWRQSSYRWNDGKSGKHSAINGEILDIAYNTASGKLVAILTDGTILFCEPMSCRHFSSTGIIINFNVDAYDFHGCICSPEVSMQLASNGAETNQSISSGT